MKQAAPRQLLRPGQVVARTHTRHSCIDRYLLLACCLPPHGRCGCVGRREQRPSAAPATQQQQWSVRAVGAWDSRECGAQRGTPRQEALLTVRAAPKALNCVFMPHLSAIGPECERGG